jgi:hypothetical protein
MLKREGGLTMGNEGRTRYAELIDAEFGCKECPHPVCGNRDNGGYECPARVNERKLQAENKRLEEQVAHWKKKYQEKIFANE